MIFADVRRTGQCGHARLGLAEIKVEVPVPAGAESGIGCAESVQPWAIGSTLGAQKHGDACVVSALTENWRLDVGRVASLVQTTGTRGHSEVSCSIVGAGVATRGGVRNTGRWVTWPRAGFAIQ